MHTTIWNFNGIAVHMTGADIAPNPCFCGVLLYTQRGIGETQYAQWWAMPSNLGYAISLRTISGREFTVSQSATWNLGLEVAAFANSVL